MSVDSWTTMLQDLEPNMEKLYMVLQDGSQISARLLHFNQDIWMVVLEETFPEYVHYPTYELDRLNDRLDWMTAQLSTWDGVQKVTYDTWKFDKKISAEKFITLYNITWVS